MTPLFSLDHKRAFGFEFFNLEDRIPRPIPRFVVSLVSDFPYDVRKVAVMTILYPKMYLYQNLLRHPIQWTSVISRIFLSPIF